VDPNVALAELREAVEELRSTSNSALGMPGDEAALANAAEDVAERFEALDTWLAGGGFLPADWNARRSS
jgi:hypothetical protein